MSSNSGPPLSDITLLIQDLYGYDFKKTDDVIVYYTGAFGCLFPLSKDHCYPANEFVRRMKIMNAIPIRDDVDCAEEENDDDEDYDLWEWLSQTGALIKSFRGSPVLYEDDDDSPTCFDDD